MKRKIRLYESDFFNLIKKIVKESYTVDDQAGDFKVISDKKGHQTRKLGNWQSDNAWDLAAPKGTSVFSYTDGIVKKIFTSTPSEKIFGTQVTVTGTNGYPDIFYTHLDDVNLTLGQKIKVGDLVGKISDWVEHPEWTHVHVGLSDNYDLKDLIEKGVQPIEKKIIPHSENKIKSDNTYDYKTSNGKYYFRRKGKTKWIRSKAKKGIDAIKSFLEKN